MLRSPTFADGFLPVAAALRRDTRSFNSDSGSLSLYSQKTPSLRQGDGANGYVEPATCGECHGAIAESYRHTRMARSIYKPDPANMVEDFDNQTTVFHHASGDYYTMIRRGNEYFQRRHQMGDVTEAKAQYQATLKTRPDLDTANLGLGLLLARMGDRASSRSHCETALKSSDSDIREQARRCLER